jgi:hypothetical protein
MANGPGRTARFALRPDTYSNNSKPRAAFDSRFLGRYNGNIKIHNLSQPAHRRIRHEQIRSMPSGFVIGIVNTPRIDNCFAYELLLSLSHSFSDLSETIKNEVLDIHENFSCGLYQQRLDAPV